MIESELTLAGMPQWIERMYPGRTGRDHLGLTAVHSGEILPSLSPQVNVLTVHPRYHSFYAFVLDEYWSRDLPRSRQSLIDFFRPAEFIYSVAANLCDGPTHGDMFGVVGSDATSSHEVLDRAEFDVTYDYIQSRLGGFGLYYASPMDELGLVVRGGPGLAAPVDAPTPDGGKPLAQAFRSAIADTRYYKEYFGMTEGTVPRDVVLEYGRKACHCHLAAEAAPDLAQLRDVLLHRGTDPDARRDTFRMFLDLAEQTDGSAIREDDFRQLLYFQRTASGLRFKPRESTARAAALWRMYQTREYYAFALNTLWRYFCGWGTAGGGEAQPLPLAEFWHHLQEVLDSTALAERLGVEDPRIGAQSTIAELEEWLKGLAGCRSDDFDDCCGLESPVHEHRLYELASKTADDDPLLAPAMMAMLALLILRFGDTARRERDDWRIASMGGPGRISLDYFLSTVRDRFCPETTLAEFVRWVFERCVVSQHMLIASAKMPTINTYRFYYDGNGLRFFDRYNAIVFLNSRFTAITTTLHDLGLCGDFRDAQHGPTLDGLRLLPEGDL